MTATNLCRELKEVDNEATTLRKQLTSLQGKSNVRNIQRRQKRKLKKLRTLEEVIIKLTDENKHLTLSLKKMENNFEQNKQKSTLKLNRCWKRYFKKKMQYKARLRRTLKAQNAVVTESTSESDVVASYEDEQTITVDTYDKGHFNSKVRECCMQLLAHNVEIHNIKAVCELIGCKPDRLPSKSTLANMMVEAHAISHLQIAVVYQPLIQICPTLMVKNMAVCRLPHLILVTHCV